VQTPQFFMIRTDVGVVTESKLHFLSMFIIFFCIGYPIKPRLNVTLYFSTRDGLLLMCFTLISPKPSVASVARSSSTYTDTIKLERIQWKICILVSKTFLFPWKFNLYELLQHLKLYRLRIRKYDLDALFYVIAYTALKIVRHPTLHSVFHFVMLRTPPRFLLHTKIVLPKVAKKQQTLSAEMQRYLESLSLL